MIRFPLVPLIRSAWLAIYICLLAHFPLPCSFETVQSIIDKAAGGSVSLPSQTFSGSQNCSSRVNASHAVNGVVTITGSSGTTIDCSGTGLRCLSIFDVSVIVQGIKFVGNRAQFPPSSIQAAPSPLPAHSPPFAAHASSEQNANREFSSNNGRASADPSSLPDVLFNRFSQLGSILPLHRTFRQPDTPSQLFSPPAHAAASVAAAPYSAPVAGGCIVFFNTSAATLQDCDFSNCASSAVGGSVAMFLVATVRVARSQFTDSLVNVADNATYVDHDPDQIIARAKSLGAVFEAINLGRFGYGGALFIAPKRAAGISISISDCAFSRCRVSAVASGNSAYNGTILQGGAFSAFLPVVNKSGPLDTGYLLSITRTSFKQCVASHSVSLLSRGTPDVVAGGAISVFDVGIPAKNESFILPPSRVIFQDMVLSGMSFCTLVQPVLSAHVCRDFVARLLHPAVF